MPTIAYRLHKCKNCGAEKRISTNHTLGCLDYCPNCSWKPSFEGDGSDTTAYKIPALGSHTYRAFECIEPEPVWKHSGAEGDYHLWTCETAEGTVYQVTKGETPQGSGGYFDLAALEKIKGVKFERWE